jgi:hypothetical protein
MDSAKSGAADAPHNYNQAPKRKGFRFNKTAIIVAVVVLLALVGAFFASKVLLNPTLVKKDQYQAVFLTNGQVYFGKLESGGPQFLRLKDVYYLQTSDSTEKTGEASAEQPAEDSQTQTLIRLGKEIHGPDNEMLISREQVLFFENISNDGTVGKAIKSDKDKK